MILGLFEMQTCRLPIMGTGTSVPLGIMTWTLHLPVPLCRGIGKWRVG